MEAASVPQQPPPETEEAVLAALTLLLLSGQAAQVVIPQGVPLLGALGVAADAAKLALTLAIASPIEYPRAGAAQAHIARTSYPRRAAYIVSAARRFDAGGTLEVERRYLEQHMGAERARVEAASKVDRAAAEHGPILGWKARLDAATTKACRAASGKNFDSRRAPTLPEVEEGERVTGYPGTPHGGVCRCVAVPPYPGATLLA